jgi:hypothetical protein
MIISSILQAAKLTVDDKIKALWTPCDDNFEKFCNELAITKIDFHQIYYGNSLPNIIICNDKVRYYDLCYSVSRKLHLPVLLIDHQSKNAMYDAEKIKRLDLFPCLHHICISKQIRTSWQLQENIQILSYDINNKDNISIWNNTIFQTSQKTFKI